MQLHVAMVLNQHQRLHFQQQDAHTHRFFYKKIYAVKEDEEEEREDTLHSFQSN